MAEEKGLLASAIEKVKFLSVNGNGVHDEEASSASDTPETENANGQDSKVETDEPKARAATEGSEGTQTQRVVCLFSYAISLLAMSEFRLYPLNNDCTDVEKGDV